MNHQLQTQEISDADLDNVSGGLVGGAVGNLVGTVDAVVPVSGAIGDLTGTVDGLTGLNTTGAANFAAGL
ncbi:type A2 lantipeptide [Streptomyces solincola]|uniref:Type A2 lantipeptide n=1 Tax=Streptomyces solincola TaxID=2100817 RepID=A0A2S9PNC8_9ACTN|nr:type A2 lantipeptide [Streptomyces solincola]PRH75920.1 type A2 lantipeptide [Streptomyces solincola]